MLEETGVPVIFDAILDSLNYDEYKELEKEIANDEKRLQKENEAIEKLDNEIQKIKDALNNPNSEGL